MNSLEFTKKIVSAFDKRITTDQKMVLILKILLAILYALYIQGVISEKALDLFLQED